MPIMVTASRRLHSALAVVLLNWMKAVTRPAAAAAAAVPPPLPLEVCRLFGLAGRISRNISILPE